MKKSILVTILFLAISSSSLFAQFIVKETFFETQGVSNTGVVSGYEAQAGPYSLWNPDDNTFVQIGGAAPGLGVGGGARFSADGNLLSGTSYINTITTTEWEKLNTGYNYIFKNIEFPSNQNSTAFAAGESSTYNGDGIILVTYDSGDSWNQLWTGINQGIEAMSFPSLYTGYVGGWNQYFAKTTDGGYTWTPQTPDTDVYIYTGIEFKDEFNGVVTAQTNTGVGVYITNDGGTTWTTGSGLTGVTYKLTYVEGDTYYLVTNGGDIQRSTDNGLTWTTVYSSGGLLLGIEFFDTMIGIATGEDNIYVTTDGGATWVNQEVLAGALWRDVAWLDQDHVTLVGTPELIFGSEDGGSTWPIDNLGTTTFNEALYEVLFTPNGTGFIIGSQGVLFRKASESNTYSVQSMYNIADGEWTVLGDFNYPVDNSLSSGYNISADGSTIVGSAWVEPNPTEPGLATHATAWTLETGLIDLGSLYSDINRSTRANAVSGDGSIVVGWQDFNGPWKSAVWRKDANGDYLPNEYLLIDPNGDPMDEYNQLGEALAISSNGNWIGGIGDYANNNEPWLWSEDTGYMSLGTLNPNGTGYVTGISNDGSVVIGFFNVGPWDPHIPFIWTPAGGIQELNNFVSQTLGYDMGASPIYTANALSENGKYITGWGYDPTIGAWGDLFTFRIELPIVPTNDECIDAIALECGDLVTNSTIFGTDNGGNGSPDVFYSYTGNGSPELITLNACGPNTNFSTTVRVYSDCDLTNQITFNDSSCENQQELTFESDGSSTYIIMVEGYDSSSLGNFQLQISCEDILGTNTFENKAITIFPNPVENILHISAINNIDNIYVYDITGAEIFSKAISNSNFEIDFSSFSNGVYFVKTVANNTVESFKVIKE
ncbi:T9SS type A sorting domain-containing protein [Aureisphaera sp. CAU 1614]|uniref:T9SS type A sorting domain-containing protein n=1 Tax=Halomarinibacterium sedimenti TaxID=2857106 RepID=A0A9X1FP14_9FLAO|nr:YCF48-related protein [Halomarinibacterium sedimenti]MBW2937748.1 T9SS type A sorting domain-containing protein [Halomarinibacterium sedimenti]